MTKISFAEFQERALYGPAGFFSQHDVVGRRGNFVTSPSLGSVFARVLGNALDQWWSDLGEPSAFPVLECGGADGALAKAIASLDLRCSEALRYVVVERSTAARDRLEDAGISFLEDLPSEPFDGVIFANELLDNIPVSLFEFDGDAWQEACYDELRRAEVLRSVLPTAAERLDALVPFPRIGTRVPLQTEARGWVATALKTVSRGRVVCIDYARTTFEMAELAQHEWLRTYRDHHPGTNPLSDPGMQDITCDVAIDQMPDAHRSTQAEFLMLHGVEGLRVEARKRWEAGAAEGGLDAMQAYSELSEIDALTDPDGLGGFTVFEWIVA